MIYRVELKKGRLVDRFSDELFRFLPLFPEEREEMWDVPSLPHSQRPAAVVSSHLKPPFFPPHRRLIA